MRAPELKTQLITQLSMDEKIKGIGQTGNIEAQLIPGKSDIDLFVLCTEVPSQEERKQFYSQLTLQDFTLQMEVCGGGIWGYGDILVMDGIDVMPMYFTITEMKDYLEEVLQCRHLDKDGRFYPVGRLASISTIHILYEEDTAWTSLKTMVNNKPASFFQTWYENEINQVIDEEDLGRSELRREVLFFHQVLENALDHLLQALYAVNFCYFPSRKRTLEALESFQWKPERCGERLLKMITNAVEAGTMDMAIEDLRKMTEEIKEAGHRVFRYPYGYCGMPCALCTRFRTEGSSKCPGCSADGYYTATCKVHHCCKEKGNEHCGSCDTFPCARVSKMGEFSDLRTDNAKIKNCNRIAEHGFDAWFVEYKERCDLLTTALTRYNNGRMKRYLCELFIQKDIETLRDIMKQAEGITGDLKECGKAFQQIVEAINIDKGDL